MKISHHSSRIAAGLLIAALMMTVLSGCSRKFWREQADHDSYELIAEKMNNPAWWAPRMDITPDPRSRFFDPFDPDHEPLPPDDAAANELLYEVGGWKGYKNWHKLGRAFSVENPHWLDNLVAKNSEDNSPILQTSSEGVVSQEAGLVDLNLGDLIELSYIHNRDYQTEIENVYLQALDVSQERFAFDVRYLRSPGSSGSTPILDINGESIPDGRNSVGFTSGLGISQVLPSGAQWALELTNNTLWVFSGGSASSASAISYSIVQPLMRNAGRKVGLEGLTLSERQLLYSVRDLARFRKEFFSDVTGRGGYLGLLLQIQQIDNQRSNIVRLERQLEALIVLRSQDLEEGQEAKSLDILQLASSLARSENRLRESEISLQDSYDGFKISLGLPPDMKFSIDTQPLDRFQLIDPALIAMENRVYLFKGEYWGHLAPPGDNPLGDRTELPFVEYEQTYQKLKNLYDDVIKVVVRGVEDDFRKIEEVAEKRLAKSSDDERTTFQQNIENDRRALNDAKTILKDMLLVDSEESEKPNKIATSLGALKKIENLLAQGDLTREQKQKVYQLGSKVQQVLNDQVKALQVVQVHQRVEAVLLEPFDLSLEETTQLALENRLDLKNSRAILNDRRRAVEIAANELEGALNIRVEGDVNTSNGSNNPLDFQGSASSFRAGLEFDTPLDQLQERNNYRASQIAYQRARREYMAAEDAVKQDVRNEWRQIQILKQNFETARRQIRVAAFELDAAIEDANDPGAAGGSGLRGRNLLNALNSVLSAQDNFIGIWVQYENNRINIYRDMGIMKVNDGGVWEDRYYQFLAKPSQNVPKTAPNRTVPQPFPDFDVNSIRSIESLPLPDRSEAKEEAQQILPPLPAQAGPAEFPEAMPHSTSLKLTETPPRKGLPGRTSSQIVIRPRTTDIEELRNAQKTSHPIPPLEVPIESSAWKLPVVR
ncbi:MAG: TolC family protein [Planctomycetaceae bacterium]|nr:TolC family protein [Planctomycetaceae bacterium]